MYPMLRVSRVTDRSGAYYLNDLAAELGPYSALEADDGSPGVWLGRATRPLGLAGPVRPSDLVAVLSGRPPGAERPLTRHRGLVAAFDLTFAAPKCVSVLWALSGPQRGGQILLAQRAATEGAMSYVERHAVAVRRSNEGERELIGSRGVIGAAFTHGLSRALDPHLHTHVVVANVAHGDDGRWSAIDGRGLYAHSMAAGRLYDTHLRAELSARLGVGWSPRQWGWDIAGIDPIVIGAFSSRRAELSQRAAEYGGSSRSARQVAWAATRDPKAADVSAVQLARLWRAVGAGVGVGPGGLDPVVGRDPPGRPVLDERRFASALDPGPHASATRRDVIAAWSTAVAQGQHASAVESVVDRLVPTSESEVGVAERAHGLSGIMVRPHLLRTLGPRPASPEDFGRWDATATEIDRYRLRWGVESRTEALGVAGSGPQLQKLPAGRLADHLTVTRRVEETLRHLGRTTEREVGRGLGMGLDRLDLARGR